MSTVIEPDTATEYPRTSRAAPAVTSVPPAPAPARRSKVLPILIVLGAIGLGWFGKNWWYGRSHESTENAQVDGHIVPVIAKVGGYVSAVNVEENQKIAANAIAVRLDDSEYRVRLAQAEAEYAAAVAAAGNGKEGGQATAAVDVAQSQRAVTDAQLASAQATYTKAKADLARIQELADKQIVSKQALDAARAAEESQRNTLIALQRQQSAAGSQVTSAQGGVRFAEARLAAVRAARDNAALQLSYTRIIAPATGLASRKQVEVGQLVQPGQTLFSVVGDSGVWITANLKETQLETVRVGQKAEIEVDACPGTPVNGVVESIAPATGARFALLPPDNATGNFTKVVQRVPVRIRPLALPGDCALRPGMSVTVHIETK